MKIKLYWPSCNFLNRQWVKERIDLYWVECTFEEAERNVFPYLSLEQIEESKRNPYSGQWNDYCPFRELKEIEINELKEVSSIIIEV